MRKSIRSRRQSRTFAKVRGEILPSSPDNPPSDQREMINNARVALVVSRFNADITDRLLEAARATFHAAGVAPDAIKIVRVPGAFEIPVAARQCAISGRFDGILCLGCVMRGATPHFEHISRECAHGIQQVALSTGVPTIFGVLTCETREEADERSGGRYGNIGADGARTLLEMVDVMHSLSHNARRRTQDAGR